MRIGVIARRLQGQRLGIGRYIEYLLKNWVQMAQPSDKFILYVREPLDENDIQLSKAFEIQQVKSGMTGILWENLVLPRYAKELDVLFCPSYTVPLTYRGRCVVATHSVNEAQSGTHPWWYRLTYTPWYRLSAQKADRVIVPSQSTKSDIQKHYGIPVQKIDVVPEGADDSFRPLDDQELLRRIRQRYFGSDRPYILFVDKLSQRRSIPTLMAAFSELKKRYQIPHGLLLVGPNHLGLPLAQLAKDLEISDSVVQTDGKFTHHHEIIPIYNAADLYVYPSLYDGFSLTMVEAMACGLPLIAANRAAQAEIAGGYALLVDDVTVETLSDAIARVLNDQKLREDLRAKSLERARSFRWEDTARRTLEILRQVAQE